MAELRPYEQTWRDRLASMLLGDGRASLGAQQFVEGLLGSRGLGTTGMGLVDLTPAGIPMAAQEAQRDVNAGNYVGGILGATAVLPAAKVAAIPAKIAANEVAQGIRAYHGSPHSFDKFDMSKIGTGEGAQVYGHGLYFAENEGVAKGYRDALSKSGTEGAQRRLKRAGGDIDKAITDTQQLADKYRSGGANNYALAAEEDLRFLQKYKDTGEWTPGQMYEVNIRANPERFLDWDKPLEQQSDYVKQALTNHPVFSRSESIGEPIARAMKNQFFAGDIVRENKATPEQVSQYLQSLNIPGIKYLDQGSRAAGEGSRNYVVFDQNIIDILRKYGLFPGIAVGGAAGGGLLGDNSGGQL